ncbi:thymidine kinase [candidate division KSB1 bacterium]|nr:thymidine kinase [candidate division KSB1 bacterium]NIR70356.1 thymidine kinase [candidate division KSB1 bacterium]NIS24480.1 thymidine kinase [candidate division KSB1 bacterium]NIT71408.1 thymidine kinase [candidate division KSB1 bacterium]NIU23543.1 thymidine kinase [candidate division KSB1 bacterium]
MLDVVSKDLGWIEVITGSMFSGKSEELIRRLRRAQIARQNVAIFNPKMDTRFSNDHIVSHSEQKIPSIAIEDVSEILEHSRDAKVVGIDEVQFLGQEVVPICEKLASEGKRVIVAGLDQDYRGVPFEPIPHLLAIAESITKTLAICVKCGNPANRTQRITKDKDRVIVGATNIYEARCRKCYEPPEE